MQIDTGVKLTKRGSYVESETMYCNGYMWAMNNKGQMSRQEMERIAALDVKDSHMEGVHDALEGKANRYG